MPDFWFRNVNKVKAEIAKRGKRWPAAMAIAVYEEMKIIFEMSQNLVPVDTGELRASGVLDRRPNKSVESFFIEYTAQHAVKIHNDSSYDAARAERALSNPGMVGKCNSGIGAIGGTSRFLEKPWRQRQRGMMGRIERETRKNEAAGRTNRRAIRKVRGKKCGQ